MNCSLCGTALTANSKFCKQCGTLQPVSSTPSPPAPSPLALEKECGQCHTVNTSQAKFCLQCGQPFSSDTAPLAASVQQASSAPSLQDLIKAPQEIQAGSATATVSTTRPGIKWALAGTGIVVIALAAWLALQAPKASPLASSAANDTDAATPTTKPQTDQERAELLVGPQGVQSPATTATVASPRSPEVANTTATPAPVPSSAPAMPAAVPVTALPVPTQVERPTTAPSNAPPAAPSRQPAPKSPTLDDLLD